MKIKKKCLSIKSVEYGWTILKYTDPDPGDQNKT